MKNKKWLAFSIAATLLSLGYPYSYVNAATSSQIKVEGTNDAFNDLDVDFNGYQQAAVTAVNNGELTLSGSNKVVNSNGNWGAASHGIAAQGNGTVILSEGSDTSVVTKGNVSHGVYADSGGTVVSNGSLNIETQFNDWSESHGLAADNGKIILGSGSETVITTSGPGAHGVYAANGGDITGAGSLDITTNSAYAYGLMAKEDGKITLTGDSGVKIQTNADGAHSIYASGGEINVGGGVNATTQGRDSHGIAAQASGQVKLAEGAKIVIATEGLLSHGFYAESGSITSNANVEITTQKDNTSGFFAQNGKISQTGILAVTTDGKQAHGVFAGGSSSEVTLAGQSKVVTHGENAHALYAQDKGVLQLDGVVTAETDGEGSSGLFVNSGAKITVAGSSMVFITTAKDNAVGVDAKGGQITLSGSTQVVTEGSGAYGVAAQGYNSNADLGNVFITTSGADAHGMIAENGGKVSFDGTAVIAVNKTDGAYAVYANQYDSSVEGQGLLDINGGIHAANGGKVLITAEAGSRLDGDITAESAGISDIELGAGSLFTGIADVSGGGSENNLTLGSASLWKMTGSSTLTSLTNNAVIDMTQDGNGFSSLTVDNLHGDGTVIMDIDGTAVDQSDKLIVKDTFTGKQVLSLQELNGRDSDIEIGQAAVGTVLASVNNGDGVFAAADHEGSLYWERYELDSLANANTGYTDWYLKAVNVLNPGDTPTTTVQTALSAGSLAYHTWRADNKLMERMGDLRQSGGEAQGVWVRVKGSKLGHSGKYGFENKYTTYELGYDQLMKQTDAYTRYGGVSVSYGDGSSSYESGSGDNKNKAVNFYMTQLGAKGHYLDVVAKFNQMDNDFTVFDSNGKKISGDFDNTGVSLSAEYGRKNSLSSNGWYIEPQAQMTVGYLGSSSYVTNKVEVDQSGISSVVGRIGFNLGRDINKTTNFYVKANLLHEFSGDYEAAFTDKFGNRAKLEDDFSDTWFEYGVGVAFQGSKNTSFYLDVERSAGSDYKKDWQWNVGARWTF